MIEFVADCAKCAALCCAAPSFSRGDDFALDKPAHTACLHLTRDARCRIHAELAARGFRGCAHYDCAGAGPHVTAMFASHSWREDAAIASLMFDVFLVVRVLHEELQLLETLRRLHLDGDREREVEAMRAALEHAGQGDIAAIARVDALALRRKNRALLARIGRAIGGKARLVILE